MTRDKPGRQPPPSAKAAEPADETFDPLVPLAPLDPVDALFKAAQAAVVGGEDRVEVTPECRVLAAALRAMYREGPAAMTRVRALVRTFPEPIPRVMGAHDDCLDELLDDSTYGVPPGMDDLDTARIMRMSRSSLIRLVDRLLAEQQEDRRRSACPTSPGALTDDELRTAVREFGRRKPSAEQAVGATPSAARDRRPSS